ncbi:Uncharacterised protein [Streptococcus pneumoniae]|nr:Uncharacterised protein [Streptococcus pneumoniae]
MSVTGVGVSVSVVADSSVSFPPASDVESVPASPAGAGVTTSSDFADESSELDVQVTGWSTPTVPPSVPSAPFAAASVEDGVSGFDGAGVFSDVDSGNAGWTSGTPLSLTTASGNAGWIAGSPLSVTTAAGSSG